MAGRESGEVARKLYDRIVAKARDDSAFRKALLRRPRKALEQELGVKLPKDLVIRVQERPTGELAFVTGDQSPGELTDAEVAAVAGGGELVVGQQVSTTEGTEPNLRQQNQTMFENFDQKTVQLFNMLSTVLKSEKEMQSGITSNIN